jgi:hypothetical protein
MHILTKNSIHYILQGIMSAEYRPNVPEELAPVTVTHQAERDYFKNLSNRLLSRITLKMTGYPAISAIGVVAINAAFKDLLPVAVAATLTMERAAVTGIAAGTIMGITSSAMEIWRVRHEHLPRE